MGSFRLGCYELCYEAQDSTACSRMSGTTAVAATFQIMAGQGAPILGEAEGRYKIRSQVRQPSSDFEEVFAHSDRTLEMGAGRLDPHLLGHLRIVRWYKVRKHQNLYTSRLCNTSGIFR